MAGPIERAKHLLPQFYQFPAVQLGNFTDGISLFLVGLFKKLALANYLSFYVERVYDNPKTYGAPALIMATFAFAWQIFFDFSGYTDMARGVARLMGFKLILNFNNPYLATGLGDFWSRWHISLSSWFRDYVYIPLGGNRSGKFNTYRNLFLTFLISGIWHGAAWTFAIWGVLHALGVIITRELERSEFYREQVPKILKQLAVFAFVCFAWIFFRAPDLGAAWGVICRIGSLTFSLANISWPLAFVLSLALAAHYAPRKLYDNAVKLWVATPFYAQALAMILLVLALQYVAVTGAAPFIYTRF
jgi:D-alanyl-lipoteichoic acid acyltransferase DltB (MBOAT superfamily)